MVVEFCCPNGHPISCSESRVGKPAKCPKCATKFVVPDPATDSNVSVGTEKAESGGSSRMRAVPLEDGKSGESGSKIGGSGSKIGAKASDSKMVAAKKTATGDIIVFFCPNGHKLNGPAKLAGTAGQCPHCGEKFNIPAKKDEGEPDDDLPLEPLDESVEAVEDDGIEAIEEFEPIEEVEDLDEIEEFEDLADIGDIEPVEEFPDDAAKIEDNDADVVEELPDIETLPSMVEGIHTLANLFNWMWDLRDEETVVELALGDGDLLTPQLYARELSGEKYGVFAINDASGAFTVITVPWDQVTQVSVRKIASLPEGLFE